MENKNSHKNASDTRQNGVGGKHPAFQETSNVVPTQWSMEIKTYCGELIHIKNVFMVTSETDIP